MVFRIKPPRPAYLSPTPTSDFKAEVRTSAMAVALHLCGRFDFLAHPIFRHASRTALAHPGVRRITVDLTEATYMDSAALGMLLMLHDGATQVGATLTLRGAQAPVQRVLDIARFERLFTIERT